MSGIARKWLPLYALSMLVAGSPAVAGEPPADVDYWLEPMRAVHARFTGRPGTFADFGDSITISMAFWAPLRDEPRGLSPEAAAVLQRVKFQDTPGDEYQVPTLISRDGVHPSHPKAFVHDFSEKGLNTNGYGLRSYLVLRAYGDVIERVLDPTPSP